MPGPDEQAHRDHVQDERIEERVLALRIKALSLAKQRRDNLILRRNKDNRVIRRLWSCGSGHRDLLQYRPTRLPEVPEKYCEIAASVPQPMRSIPSRKRKQLCLKGLTPLFRRDQAPFLVSLRDIGVTFHPAPWRSPMAKLLPTLLVLSMLVDVALRCLVKDDAA